MAGNISRRRGAWVYPVAMLITSLTTVIVAASMTTPTPPKTEIKPVTETLHGVAITDNYRWLEGDNSDPKTMGKVSDEVSSWTDAQNAYTRSVLDNLPGRKAVEDAFRPLMQIGTVSAPTMAGDRYFYSKREGTENQPRIFMKMKKPDGTMSEARVILDPAKIDPSGLTALGGMLPSHDGKMVAFGLYRRGDENTTVYFMDVDSGKWLPDTLESKAQPVQWLPDNSGLFYERLENANDPYSARIMFHTLGQHPRFNPVLFKQYTKAENEKLATTWGPGATVSRDGKWMVLSYWTGTSSNDVWAIDLTKWWKDGVPGGGVFEKVDIKVGAENTFFGSIEGDTFYMLTDYKAPQIGRAHV